LRSLGRTSRRRYARLRQGTFEVRKGGASRFDLRDPFHLAVAAPWSGFVVGGLLALLLLNLAFAGLYLAAPNAIRGLPPADFARALFFSLETLSTVGYGEMSPQSLYGYVVSGAEIVVGMAFVALLTGLLFFRFSQTGAGLVFAEHAVIGVHNGKQTLMVRVGNARLDMLTEATATLSILLKEVTDEGMVLRRYHHLPLVCNWLPAFPLTWTLMHVIDTDSAIYGYDTERLRADWGRLFLSIRARDAKLGRTVQDLADFDDTRIVFGADYVDAVTYDEHGVGTADLSMLGRLARKPGAPKDADLIPSDRNTL
jgi:inward rectifier potassium channel